METIVSAHPVRPEDLAPPAVGFGKLWAKTYQLVLEDLDRDPAEMMDMWKARFDQYWPDGSTLHGDLRKMQPQELIEMDVDLPSGGSLGSGVALLFARPESFALVTPRGHMFSGWIAFSITADGANRVVRIEMQFRASDPLFEIGMQLFGHRREDHFWLETLSNLAATWPRPGVPTMEAAVIDPHRQWSQAGNIRHNAAIRSVFGRGATVVNKMTRRGGHS